MESEATLFKTYFNEYKNSHIFENNIGVLIDQPCLSPIRNIYNNSILLIFISN